MQVRNQIRIGERKFTWLERKKREKEKESSKGEELNLLFDIFLLTKLYWCGG